MKKRCIIFAAILTSAFLLSSAATGQIHLGLELGGARTWVQTSDIRTDNDLFIRWATAEHQGGFETLDDRGTGYSGEILATFTDRFGVGLEFEYFWFGFKNKRADWGWSPYLYTGQYYVTSHTVIATPIFLNGYFTFPLFKKATISSFIGMGRLFCDYDAAYDWMGTFTEIPPNSSKEQLVTHRIRIGRLAAEDSKVGFKAGFSFDLSIVPGFQLFVECQYRYAKLADWKGTSTVTKYWEGKFDYQYKLSGKLWYLERDENAGDPPYPLQSPVLRISEQMPSVNYLKARQAEIDLSGFSVGVGMKFRLF